MAATEINSTSQLCISKLAEELLSIYIETMSGHIGLFEGFEKAAKVISKEAAKVTFLAGAALLLDGIPGVGHLKALVHYVCGDKEGGDAAMISSSRATGVKVGASCGFLFGGPPGAAVCGAAGGALVDYVTTAVDSAIHGKTRTHGIINVVEQICNDPTDPWNYYDLVAVLVADAFTGYLSRVAKCEPEKNPPEEVAWTQMLADKLGVGTREQAAWKAGKMLANKLANHKKHSPQNYN